MKGACVPTKWLSERVKIWQTGEVFLKRHVRRKNGKEHVYYSLAESIRLSGSRTIQRRVLNLGELNTTQIEGWQRSIEVIEKKDRAGSIDFLPIGKVELRPMRLMFVRSFFQV